MVTCRIIPPHRTDPSSCQLDYECNVNISSCAIYVGIDDTPYSNDFNPVQWTSD